MNEQEFLDRLRTIDIRRDLHVYGESGRRLSSDRARKNSSVPKVYTIDNIADLFASFDMIYEPQIRFVIDKDERALFGEMGPLIGSTPGHEEMSNHRCLTAGVLTFDGGYKTITGISHRSGFFKPSLESLVWAFKFLFSMTKFELPSTLDIDYSETDASWFYLKVNTEALRAVVNDLSLNKMDVSDEPFASYADEMPKVFRINGNVCSPSCENLHQLGFFSSSAAVASVNNRLGVAETDDDERDYFSPLKKPRMNSQDFSDWD